MSNASVTIDMCYVYNQWSDISCATLYVCMYVCMAYHIIRIYIILYTFYITIFICLAEFHRHDKSRNINIVGINTIKISAKTLCVCFVLSYDILLESLRNGFLIAVSQKLIPIRVNKLSTLSLRRPVSILLPHG